MLVKLSSISTGDSLCLSSLTKEKYSPGAVLIFVLIV